tara:strand:- start:414 stop:596 length:183 start_codon:yes stop_codon:yes gene_type:complete
MTYRKIDRFDLEAEREGISIAQQYLMRLKKPLSKKADRFKREQLTIHVRLDNRAVKRFLK